MTVIPDTSFDEDGWSDAITDIIALRKRVRALELKAVGYSNDMNQSSEGWDQSSEGYGYWSPINIANFIQQVVRTSSSSTTTTTITGGLKGFTAIDTGSQTVNAGNTDLLTLGTVIFDSESGWDAANNKYVFPTSGVWVLIGAATTESLSAGAMYSRMILRSTAQDYAQEGRLTTGAVPATLRMPTTAAVIASVTAGDTLKLYLNNGGVSTSNVFDRSLSAFTVG